MHNTRRVFAWRRFLLGMLCVHACMRALVDAGCTSAGYAMTDNADRFGVGSMWVQGSPVTHAGAYTCMNSKVLRAHGTSNMGYVLSGVTRELIMQPINICDLGNAFLRIEKFMGCGYSNVTGHDEAYDGIMVAEWQPAGGGVWTQIFSASDGTLPTSFVVPLITLPDTQPVRIRISAIGGALDGIMVDGISITAVEIDTGGPPLLPQNTIRGLHDGNGVPLADMVGVTTVHIEGPFPTGNDPVTVEMVGMRNVLFSSCSRPTRHTEIVCTVSFPLGVDTVWACFTDIEVVIIGLFYHSRDWAGTQMTATQGDYGKDTLGTMVVNVVYIGGGTGTMNPDGEEVNNIEVTGVDIYGSEGLRLFLDTGDVVYSSGCVRAADYLSLGSPTMVCTVPGGVGSDIFAQSYCDQVGFYVGRTPAADENPAAQYRLPTPLAYTGPSGIMNTDASGMDGSNLFPETYFDELQSYPVASHTVYFNASQGISAPGVTPSVVNISYRANPANTPQVRPCIFLGGVRIRCVPARGVGVGWEVRLTVHQSEGPWEAINMAFPAPTITSVNPSLMSTAGSETLTINGNNLGSVGFTTFATYGPYNLTNCGPQSGTWTTNTQTMVCTTVEGTGANFQVDVDVGGQLASAPSSISYSAPSITSVTTTGLMDSENDINTITIDGSNFGPIGTSVDTVTIKRDCGENNFDVCTTCGCSVQIAHTRIVCSLFPGGQGVAPLCSMRIEAGGQNSSSISPNIGYVRPTITFVSSPGSVAPGDNTTLTIQGNNYGRVADEILYSGQLEMGVYTWQLHACVLVIDGATDEVHCHMHGVTGAGPFTLRVWANGNEATSTVQIPSLSFVAPILQEMLLDGVFVDSDTDMLATTGCQTMYLVGANFGTSSAAIDRIDFGSLSYPNPRSLCAINDTHIGCPTPSSAGNISWSFTIAGQASTCSPIPPFNCFSSYLHPSTVSATDSGSFMDTRGGSTFVVHGTNFGPTQNGCNGGSVFSQPIVDATSITAYYFVPESSPPVEYSASCTGIASGSPGDMTLTCTGEPGFGGVNQQFSVYVVRTFGGTNLTTSWVSAPNVRYADPLVASVLNAQSSSTDLNPAGGERMTITGDNFGTSDAPIRVDYNYTDGGVTIISQAANCARDAGDPHGILYCDTVEGAGYSWEWVVFVEYLQVSTCTGSCSTNYASPQLTSAITAAAFDTLQDVTSPVVVTINGRGFGPVSFAQFNFTSAMVLGDSDFEMVPSAPYECTHVSDTQFSCVIPSGAGSDFYPIAEIGNTPRVPLTNQGSFSYKTPVITSSDTPSGSVPLTGGTTVTVTGEQFGPNTTWLLNGGTYTQSLVFMRLTHVPTSTEFSRTSCTRTQSEFGLPEKVECPMPVGWGADLQVTLDIGSYLTELSGVSTTNAGAVSYSAPEVTSFSPTFGPIAGGTTVDITGMHFTDVGSVDFDASVSHNISWSSAGSIFSFASPNSLNITLPSTTHAANVTMLVSIGYQPAAQPEYFVFYDLKRTVPVAAPADGGMVVTVVGENFHHTSGEPIHVRLCNTTVVVCDNSTSPAPVLLGTYVNSSRFTFVGPTAPDTTYYVYVNMNGQDWVRVPTSLLLYPDPTVTSVSPRSGPLTGGTVFQVYGVFPDSGALRVRMDTTIISCSRVSGVQLQCVSPVVTTPRETLVEVSLDHDDHSYTTDNVKFQHYIQPNITSIEFPLGPITGGSLITIRGANIVFTNDTYGVLMNMTTPCTQATFVTLPGDEGAITCYTGAVATTGFVYASIALNNAQFTSYNYVWFQYYNDPVLTAAVQPAFGPIRGGFDMVLRGTGIIAPDARLIINENAVRVKFAYGSVSAFVTAVGVRVNDTHVNVTAPEVPAGAGIATVSLSLNAYSYTPTTKPMEYYDPASITSMSPKSGPSDGTTEIQLQGTFFDTGVLMANIGSLNVPCTYESRTTAKCTSPDYTSVTSSFPASVAVSITMDTPNLASILYSSESHSFLYYGPFAAEFVSQTQYVGGVSGVLVTVVVINSTDTGELGIKFGADDIVTIAYSPDFEVEVNVFAGDEAVTNHPIRISLNTIDLDPASTCYDIRVYTSNFESAAVFFVEPDTCHRKDTGVWVLVPVVGASARRRRLLALPEVTFKVVYGEPLMSTDLSDVTSVFAHYSSMDLEDTGNWLYSMEQTVDIWNGVTRFHSVVGDAGDIVSTMASFTVQPEVGIEVGVMHEVPPYFDEHKSCPRPLVYFSPSKYEIGYNSSVAVHMNCTHLCILTFPAENCTAVHRRVERFAASVGETQTCVFGPAGISCWGDNTEGQLTVPTGHSWTQVSSGGRVVCGLTDASLVKCWGASGANVPAAQQNELFGQVSAGVNHACGKFINGTAFCWGNNTDNVVSETPTQYVFATVFTSATGTHACGVEVSNNRMRCWGKPNTYSNAQVDGTNLIDTNVKSVGLGNTHTCALILSTLTILCSSTLANKPVTGDWVAIASGTDFSCAVNKDHEIACFGADTVGETQPPTGHSWVDVAAAGHTACGIVTSGEMYCWGANTYGQATVPSWIVPRSLWAYERVAIVMRDDNFTEVSSSMGTTGTSVVMYSDALGAGAPLRPYIGSTQSTGKYTYMRLFAVRAFSSAGPTSNATEPVKESHIWEFLTPSVNSSNDGNSFLLLSQNGQNFPANAAENITILDGPVLTSVSPSSAATNSRPNITLVGTNLLTSNATIPLVKLGKFGTPSYTTATHISTSGSEVTLVFLLADYVFQGSANHAAGTYPVQFSYGGESQFGVVASSPSTVNNVRLAGPGLCSVASVSFDDATLGSTVLDNPLVGSDAATCGSANAGGTDAFVVPGSGGAEIRTRAYDFTLGGEFSFAFGCVGGTNTLTSPLLFQYSNNNGTTWKTSSTLATVPSSFQTVKLELPLDARGTQTRFRWLDHGSTGNWAIDSLDVRQVTSGDASVIATAAAPLSGPLTGGTVVNITGVNLYSASCTFDGIVTTSVVSGGGTVITCVSPSYGVAATVSLQVCGSSSPPFEFVYYRQIIPTAINMVYAADGDTFTIDGENIVATGDGETKVVYDVVCAVPDPPFGCAVSETTGVREMKDIGGMRPVATAGRKGFPLGGGAMSIARFVYPAEDLAAMGVYNGTSPEYIASLKFFIRKAPTFDIDNMIVRAGSWIPDNGLRKSTPPFGYTDVQNLAVETFSQLTSTFWQGLEGSWWTVTLNPNTLRLSGSRTALLVEFMTFMTTVDSGVSGSDDDIYQSGAGSFGYRQVAPNHAVPYASDANPRARHNGLIWYGTPSPEGSQIVESTVTTASDLQTDEPFIRTFDVSMVPMLQVCMQNSGCLSRSVLDVTVPTGGISATDLATSNVYVSLNGHEYVQVEKDGSAVTLKSYSSDTHVGDVVTDVDPPVSSPFGQTVFFVRQSGSWEDQPEYTLKFTFLDAISDADEPAETRYPVDLATWGAATGALPKYSACVRCIRSSDDPSDLECVAPQIAPYKAGVMTMVELSMNGYYFYRRTPSSWRFQFFTIPYLTGSVVPPQGPQAGGQSIAISGVNLYEAPAELTALYSSTVFNNLVVCYFLPQFTGRKFSDLIRGSTSGTLNDPDDLHRSGGSISGGVVTCDTRAEDPAVTTNYYVFVSFTGGLYNPRFNFFGTDDSGYGTVSLPYQVEVCPAGQFAEVYTDPCQDCPAGKISDVAGALECTDCEVGQYTNDEGQTACLLCPEGSTTARGRDSLESIDGENPDSFKTPTPLQDLYKTGAASASECVCDVGYLFSAKETCSFGGCCEDCAGIPGAVCPGGIELNGSYSQPWAAEGYYMLGNRESGFRFFQCSPTEACFGGPSKFCADGYDGVFCGNCAENHYRDGNRCRECPSVDFVVLTLMIILLIVFIKLFALIAPYLRGMGAPRIFFNYVAATSSFIFFNLRWPDIVIEYYDFLQYLSLNIDIVRPECQLPISFRMQFFILQMTPVVITGILFGFYGIECIRHSYMCMPLKTWWVHFRARSGQVRHWWHPLWIFEHFVYRPTMFLGQVFTILLLVLVLACIRWVFQMYVNAYDWVVNRLRARIEKDDTMDSDVASQTVDKSDPLIQALSSGGEVLDRNNSSFQSMSSYASFSTQRERGALFVQASNLDKKKKKKKKKGKRGRRGSTMSSTNRGGGGGRHGGIDEDSGPLPRFELRDQFVKMKFLNVQSRFSETAIGAEHENQTFNSTKRSSVLIAPDAPPEKLNWHDLVSKSWMIHDNVKTRFLQQSMRQEGLRDFEVLRNLQMQIMSKYPTHRDFKRAQDTYATVRTEAESSEEITEAMELQKKRTDALNTTLNALCMVLTFSHLILLRRALDMLACFDVVDGESRLAAHPDVRCWTNEHADLVVYAVISLCVWGVGMPALLFYLLYRKSVVEHSLDEHNNKARYGYMFLKYGRSHWYWEFVIILRKSLLVSILVFYQDDDDRFLQVLLALLLFLGALALQRIYDPFIEEDLNGYEFLALSNNVIVLFVGSIFLTERIPFGGANATGMGWFLIVFISVVVAILFRATWEEVMQAIPGLHELLTFRWVRAEFKRLSIQLIYGDRYIYDIAPAVAIRTSQYSDKEWARMNTFERNHIELALQRQEQLEQVPILTPVGQWCAVQWLKDVNTPPRDRDTYIYGIARNAAGVFTELFMIADRHLHNKNPRRSMELIAMLNEKRERIITFFNQADQYIEDAFCVPTLHPLPTQGMFSSVNGYMTYSEWQVDLERQVIDRMDFLQPNAKYEIEDLYEEFGDWHMCDTPDAATTAVGSHEDYYAIGCTNGSVVVGVKSSGQSKVLQPHYVPDLLAGLDDTAVMKMRPKKEPLAPITCLEFVELCDALYLVTTCADGTLALTAIKDPLDECVTIFHSAVAKNQVFSTHSSAITCLAIGGNEIVARNAGPSHHMYDSKMAETKTGPSLDRLETQDDVDDEGEQPGAPPDGGDAAAGADDAAAPGDSDDRAGDAAGATSPEPGAAPGAVDDYDDETKVEEDVEVKDEADVVVGGVDEVPQWRKQHSTSRVISPTGGASVLPELPIVAVTGAEDGSVVVWNIEALVMTHLKTLKPLPLNMLITALTATGAPSRTRVRTPLRHRGAVHGIRILHSFLLPVAVSYGADGSLRVWDLGSLNIKLRYSDLDTIEAGMVTNILRFSLKLESAINDVAIALLGLSITIVCGCENGRIYRFPLAISGGYPKPVFVSPPASIKKNPRWVPVAENHDDDVDQNRIHQLMLSDDHKFLLVVFDRYMQSWVIDPEKMVRKCTREYGATADRDDRKLATAGDGGRQSGVASAESLPAQAMEPIPSQASIQHPMPSQAGMEPIPSGIMNMPPQATKSGFWDPSLVGTGIVPDGDRHHTDRKESGRRIVMVDCEEKKHGYTIAMATNRGHIQVWQVSAAGAFNHISSQLRTLSEKVRLAPNVSAEGTVAEDQDLGDTTAAIVSLEHALGDASDSDEYEEWMAPPPLPEPGADPGAGAGGDNRPPSPVSVAPSSALQSMSARRSSVGREMLPVASETTKDAYAIDPAGEMSIIEYEKKMWYEQRYAHPYFLAPKFFTRWAPLFSHMLEVNLCGAERRLLKYQSDRLGVGGGVGARFREHYLRANAKFIPSINLWHDMDSATRRALRRTASLDSARMAIRTIKSLNFLPPSEETTVIELVKETPALATIINDLRRNNELDRIEKLLETLTSDTTTNEMQKSLDVNSEALFIGNIIRRRNKRFEWLILSLVGLPSMARDILASSTVRELASGDDWAIQPHEFAQLGVVNDDPERAMRVSSMARQSSALARAKLRHQGGSTSQVRRGSTSARRGSTSARRRRRSNSGRRRSNSSGGGDSRRSSVSSVGGSRRSSVSGSKRRGSAGGGSRSGSRRNSKV